MKVSEHLRRAKAPLLSFEILPPLKGKDIRSIYAGIDPLMEFKPSFINVTYHREEVIYKERGELERAIEYFDQAQRVDPTDRDAQRWIARLTAILLAAQEAAAGGDSDGAEDGAAA